MEEEEEKYFTFAEGELLYLARTMLRLVKSEALYSGVFMRVKPDIKVKFIETVKVMGTLLNALTNQDKEVQTSYNKDKQEVRILVRGK